MVHYNAQTVNVLQLVVWCVEEPADKLLGTEAIRTQQILCDCVHQDRDCTDDHKLN